MVIPKIIHYCWFGQSQMPELAIYCINSWKKYLPDYEFILWNEDNFDINCNEYVKEAYESKKFAFVTDYVRLYALYNYGGIYMDMDVEVLKPLDKFLKHQAFIGCENNKICVTTGTGIMAAEKNHKWIEDLLKEYDERRFILPDGSYDTTPNTQIITKVTMEEYGWKPQNEHEVLKEGLNIYPFDYFCAKDLQTGRIDISENTHTIHHFSGSWLSRRDKLKSKIQRIIGPQATQFVVNVKRKIKG